MYKICLIVMSTLFIGCGNCIYPSDYKWAETACAEHAGVNYIISQRSNSFAYCNDGTDVNFIKSK